MVSSGFEMVRWMTLTRVSMIEGCVAFDRAQPMNSLREACLE